jgi:hypothetical protein
MERNLKNIRRVKRMLYLPFSDELELRWELSKNESVIELLLKKNINGTFSLDHIVNTTIKKNLYISDPYVVCIKKVNSLIESLSESGFKITKSPQGYSD